MKIKALFGLLIGVGLTALSAPTLAADSGVADNPFHGFYAGVHGGYAWGDSEIDYEGGYLLSSSSPTPPYYGNDGGNDFSGGETLNPNGWLLGAQAGANFVASSGLLLGAEVSGSWMAMSDELDFEDGDAYVSIDQNVSSMGIAQLKLGWANDTVAIYGTGGLALASIETSVNLGYGYGPIMSAVEFDDSQISAGLTVGGGADVMVTDSVSVGVAYNYSRFEIETSNWVEDEIDFGYGNLNLDGQVDAETTLNVHSVKATLNYHF